MKMKDLMEGASATYSIKVPGHGIFSFDLGSDKYAKKSKSDLAEMIAANYEGSDQLAGLPRQIQKASYWMKYPHIVLAAILGDTEGGRPAS